MLSTLDCQTDLHVDWEIKGLLIQGLVSVTFVLFPQARNLNPDIMVSVYRGVKMGSSKLF